MKVDLYNADSFVPGVPHDVFAYLRREDPVYFHEEPGGPGFWCMTTYADVQRCSQDYVTFSSSRGTNIEDAYGGAELMMINMDPPQHTKLRSLVAKGFTHHQIRRLEEHIAEVCERIIDEVQDRDGCDFVNDIASELPLQVIAELLGIPQEDRHKIFEWSNRMIGLDDPEYGNTMEDARAAATEMWAYANQLGEVRRRDPRDDVVSMLMDAEVDGQKLTELDFDMFFLLLAVAGNETTRNSISHGMLAFMENPEQWERLRAEPKLVRSAVEEIVRWATPVMYFRRTATCDVEVHGRKIAAGDKVLLYYISANRDEEAFEDPFRFDIGRDPNDHLGFGGGGPHFCLGASLARVEIKVMFEQLSQRLPVIRPAGEVARLRSNFINGIKRMPVTFSS